MKKGSEVVGVIAEAPMEVDMELDGARGGCEVLVDIEMEMEGKQTRRCEKRSERIMMRNQSLAFVLEVEVVVKIMVVNKEVTNVTNEVVKVTKEVDEVTKEGDKTIKEVGKVSKEVTKDCLTVCLTI